jgi:hypothetical protein
MKYEKPLLNAGLKTGGTKLGTYGASQLGVDLTKDLVKDKVGGILPVAGALYSAYDTIKNADREKAIWNTKLKGGDLAMNTAGWAAKGAAIGSAIPVLGTALGGVIGGLYGLGSGMAGSGKHQDQKLRDSIIRDRMVESGFLTDDYMYGDYNMGLDGGHRTRDNMRVNEINFDNPNAGENVNKLDALGALFGTEFQQNDKMKGMTTSMLYNALNADGEITNDEIMGAYTKAGLDHGSAFEAINELHRNGIIDEDTARAYQGGLNKTFGKDWISPEDEEERKRLAEQGLLFQKYKQ